MLDKIPHNRADFETLFAAYRETKNRLDKADMKLADKTAALAAKHQQDTAADREKLAEIALCLEQYATEHRAELTNHGKSKTVQTVSGCLKWRKTPPAVQIDGDLSSVLTEIRRRKLSRFIRVKEELNKTALLAERELLERRPIAGVSIIHGKETFTIETA